MQNAECKMQNWDMIDGSHRSFYVVIARTTRSEATWWDVAILRQLVPRRNFPEIATGLTALAMTGLVVCPQFFRCHCEEGAKRPTWQS